MREIKFRGYDEENKCWRYGSFYKGVMTDNPLCLGDCRIVKIIIVDGVFYHVDPESIGQFTGLRDKNGAEIYEGDLLNVFFTSGNQEHLHDCVYEAEYAFLGLQFIFRRLLWERHGFNQYPTETTLCERYGTLDLDNLGLLVPDTIHENHSRQHTWKGLDNSRYFEVIGNIYENTELLSDER